MAQQSHVGREKTLSAVGFQVAHIDVVVRYIDVGCCQYVRNFLVHLSRNSLREHIAQSGLSPSLSVVAESLFLSQRQLRKIECHHKGYLVGVEVVGEMSHRIVGTKALVDVEQFTGVEVHVALQSKQHLVVIAIDIFKVFTHLEKETVAYSGVANIVIDAELREIGIFAISLVP